MYISHTSVTILGEAINKYYFMVMPPIGFIGNLLSFLVSIEYVFWFIDSKLAYENNGSNSEIEGFVLLL